MRKFGVLLILVMLSSVCYAVDKLKSGKVVIDGEKGIQLIEMITKHYPQCVASQDKDTFTNYLMEITRIQLMQYENSKIFNAMQKDNFYIIVSTDIASE